MSKPLVAANLPAGRVRVYLDGEPDAAFWESLKTIAEMMSKAMNIGASPASSAKAKPTVKKPRRGLGGGSEATPTHAGGASTIGAPPVVRPNGGEQPE